MEGMDARMAEKYIVTFQREHKARATRAAQRKEMLRARMRTHAQYIAAGLCFILCTVVFVVAFIHLDRV